MNDDQSKNVAYSSLEGYDNGIVLDQSAKVVDDPSKSYTRLKLKRIITASVPFFVIVMMLLAFAIWRSSKSSETPITNSQQETFDIDLPDGLSVGDPQLLEGFDEVSINGNLNTSGYLVMGAIDEPDDAKAGLIYFDKNLSALRYYNGTEFVTLLANNTQSDSGNQLTLPQDLSVTATPTFADINISGVIDVANGGTGQSSFTENGVLYGNGDQAINVTSAPTAGQVLIGSNTGSPVFVTISGDIAINSSGFANISANAVGSAEIAADSVDVSELVATGVVAGVYGSSTQVAQITVDEDGRIVSVSEVNIAGGGSGDILQGGNSFGAAVTIGTNDNFGINLETNGSTRFSINNSGAASFTGTLDVASHAALGSAAAVNNSTLINSGATLNSLLLLEEEIVDVTSTDRTSGLTNYLYVNPNAGGSTVIYGNETVLQFVGPNATSGNIYGSSTDILIDPSAAGFYGTVYGAYNNIDNQGTGAVDYLTGNLNFLNNAVGSLVNQDLTGNISAINNFGSTNDIHGYYINTYSSGTVTSDFRAGTLIAYNDGTTGTLDGLVVDVTNADTVTGDSTGINVDLSNVEYGISVEEAQTVTLWLSDNNDSTSASGGIAFGSSRDTNLFRSAANTLRTDDSFSIGGTATVATLGAADTDTVVCRNSSNQLATCSSTFDSSVTLQDAYQNSNTIVATNAEGDIDLTVSQATNFSVDITGTGSFLVQDSGSTILSVADGTGRVDVTGDLDVSSQIAVGSLASVTTNTALTLTENYTANSGSLAGLSASVGLSPGSASSANASAGSFTLSVTDQNHTGFLHGLSSSIVNSGTGTVNYAFGNSGLVQNTSSGNVAISYGVVGSTANTSSGNITFIGAGVSSQVTNSGSGTIATAAGVFATTNTNIGGGAITDNYGIYIQAQSAGSSDYGLRIDTADTQTLWIGGTAAGDGGTSNTGIAFGSSRDTNLFRSAANTLQTDDNLIVRDQLVVGSTAGLITDTNVLFEETFSDDVSSAGLRNRVILDPVAGISEGVTGIDNSVRTVIGDANNIGYLMGAVNSATHYGTGTANSVLGSGSYVNNINSGTISNASAISSSIGNLGTGDITSATVVSVGITNSSTGVITSASGLSVNTAVNDGGGQIVDNYGIYIASQDAGDNDYGLRVDTADTQTLWVAGDVDGTTANTGIAFGASRDTNLFRSAADTLRTDDSFSVGANLTVAGTSDLAGHAAIGSAAGVNDTTLIGATTTMSNLITIEESFTDLVSTDQVSGIVNYMQLNPSATGTADVFLNDSRVNILGANELQGGVVGNTVGITTDATSSGNVSLMMGSYNLLEHGGTGIASSIIGTANALNINAGATATDVKASSSQLQIIGDVTGSVIGEEIVITAGPTSNANYLLGSTIAATNDGTSQGTIGSQLQVSNTGTSDILIGQYIYVANSGTVNNDTAGLVVALDNVELGISVTAATQNTLWLSSDVDSTTAAGGITFGSSEDTNLFRSAANTLRTDDSFSIGGTATVGTLGAADTDTIICRNSSNQAATCSSTFDASVTLQDAYQNGNTLVATNAVGDIDLTVSQARSFTVDITGTGAFAVQDNGTNIFAVIDGGAAAFQNVTDSTTGFRVLDADGGNPILNVDTTNERVGIGTASPSYELDVVGDAQVSSQLQVGPAALLGTVAQCNQILAINNCSVALDVGLQSTETTNATYGATSFTTITPAAAANTAINTSFRGILALTGAFDFTGVNSGAAFDAINVGSAGTIATLIGTDSTVSQSGGGSTVTDAIGLRTGVVRNAGTLSNAYGIQVTATSGAVTANNYGILVRDQTAGASDYGISIEGADTYALWIGSGGNYTDAANGISFGNVAGVADTNIYRSATNTLTTDDTFISARSAINSTAFGTDEKLRVNTPTTTDNDAVVMFTAGATDQKAFVVQGLAGQTANLQEWQASNGSVVASMSEVGELVVADTVINGNLTVNGHLITANESSNTTIAAGAGAGAGATASVTGNDVAGFVTINTGTGAAAGTLATVTFSSAYTGAANGPSVVISAKDTDGSTIDYFVGASVNGSFTIDSSSLPADGTSYELYYHVIQFD